MALLEEADYLRKKAEEPVREEIEAKHVLSETVERLKNFLDYSQARADKHRKLAEHYQNEHDSVHNFLTNNFWDSRKEETQAKMRKDPF